MFLEKVQVMLKSCGTLPNGAQNSPPVITGPIGPQDWITTFNQIQVYLLMKQLSWLVKLLVFL